MKVSVVIPCYNMKVYLEECLSSILSQSLSEIEIICIDDGSKDGTKELLEDYQKKYNNIYLMGQENEGSGNARNKGIKFAHGEYIAFMDADDFYPDLDILEYLYNTAVSNEAKICGGSRCSYRNGVYTYSDFRSGMVFEKDGWINKEEFSSFAGFWRYLFKKDFLTENNIFFPNYLRMQDLPFFIKAISKVERVYCVKKITYCYRLGHKQLKLNEKVAIDSAKGMRDSLLISKNKGLKKIYTLLLNELCGEITGIMYYFAHKGVEEIRPIIHDINTIISENNDDKCLPRILLEGNALDEYVEKNWEERERLFSKLNEYSKILIYGAGVVGQKMLKFLKHYGYEPEAFVVSDSKQNVEEVEGIIVKQIEEYVNIQKECFIIVATFPYSHKEIQKGLYENGFQQFWLIDMGKFYLWYEDINH